MTGDGRTSDEQIVNLSMVEHYGDAIRGDLEEIFQSESLDLASFVQNGVLSCDVGQGAEIAAFTPFKPSILVATEGLEVVSGLGEINGQSLARLAEKYPKVKIVRDEPISAMENLAKQGKQFGLITHLYSFPEKGWRYSYWEGFFKAVDQVLLPSGAVVASLEWVDPDESYGVDFIRAGNSVLMDLGYKIKMPTPEGGTRAGGIFIIGIKPGKKVNA